MFAAAFDFGSYANFRAFAQKQGRAGHFCQSETDWDLSLSLSPEYGLLHVSPSPCNASCSF